MTSKPTTANLADPESARNLHRQISSEMRETVRELVNEMAELKVELQEVRSEKDKETAELRYRLQELQKEREQHAETMKTVETLVHAGIGMRYMVVATIAMLSMIGGIQVAYDTMRKWFGGH